MEPSGADDLGCAPAGMTGGAEPSVAEGPGSALRAVRDDGFLRRRPLLHPPRDEAPQRTQILHERADAPGELLGRHRVLVEEQAEALLVEDEARGRAGRVLR